MPDNKSMIMLVSPLPAETLTAEVNAGTWQPPSPYGYLAPKVREDDASSTIHNERLLYAMQLNRMVIITSISRRLLNRNRSTWQEGWQALNKRHSPLYPDNVSMEDEALALSPRQMQVLHGLARGLTTKQIALSLGITIRTARAYIKELKSRFKASTHAELVGKAAVLGLLEEKWFEDIKLS